MDALVTGVAAAAGLVCGSPLELLAERAGAKEPFVPLTRCPSCTAADARALVPVVGPLLASSCRACGARRAHGRRAVAMSFAAAAVLGALAARFGADVALAPFAVLALFSVAMSAVDLERYIIPNRLLYPTLAVVAPLLVVSSAVDHRWGSLARAAIAGAVAFVAFFAVHLAVPKGMGFGDVRLAGLLGLATGWLGLGHAFVGFFAAFVLGAVIGLVVTAVTGGGRKTRIPFGPFLAAGSLVAWLWGNPLAHAIFHRGS